MSLAPNFESVPLNLQGVLLEKARMCMWRVRSEQTGAGGHTRTAAQRNGGLR
jgi:hypothetical protein